MDTQYVPRVAETVLKRFLQREEVHKPVLLVEGARQVGKTRLVLHTLGELGPGTLRLNLERDALTCARIDDCREFREFEELLRDEFGFTGADGKVLFIDEAQESRCLGGFVRFMKEEWPRATVVLSGSTLTRLFRDDVRYPVGRVERLVVRPFSFSEFLLAIDQRPLADVVLHGDLGAVSASRHGRLLEWYDRFLEVGGLPEVVLSAARGEDFGRTQARIAADYEQDFRRLFGEESVSLVQAALRAVANFTGAPFKYATVVPGSTTRTNERIRAILARLESWHLVLRADQRGPGSEASQRYLPKRYLFDTGLLRHWRAATVPPIRVLDTAPGLRDALGAVIENQVALDLVRQGDALTGWKRSSAGHEIDFVHTLEDQRRVPVECKAAAQADGRHLRGLRAYLDLYPADLGVLVCLAPHQVTRYADGKRVLWLPAYAPERLGQLASAA